MASSRWLSEGGVTSPAGFCAGAGTGGLKESGMPDVALLVSDLPCAAAGVFTRNRVVAACVTLDRELLGRRHSRVRVLVANAGNANACTGEAGMVDARATQRLAATLTESAPDEVLVFSTGVIGVPLDMAALERGVRAAAGALSPTGGAAAAEAIMTTDTRPKQAALQVELSTGPVTLGAMAKGSGMIHPDMATMMATITTDASLDATTASTLLTRAVDRSFNRISVDGDTSTNDSVFLLAGGEGPSSVASDADRTLLAAALEKLCVRMAQAIVRDGEGASRFVSLEVSGAATEADAVQVGRTIATSPLVKTAFAGGDPNWGRILAAAGRAGVDFDPAAVRLSIGGAGDAELVLVEGGTPTDYEEEEAAALFAQAELTVRLSLFAGPAAATVWTTDLSHDYVTINADYRT